MVHNRPGNATPNSRVPPLLPFAAPDAGFDYFATQTHYESLASLIITALGGFNVVVVTGDQLSSASKLSDALGEAAAGRCEVIPFLYRPDLGGRGLLHFRRALSPRSANESTTGGDTCGSAVVVFDDIDHISDNEIEEIFRHVHENARIGDHRINAAVFVTRNEFLARLDHTVRRPWLAKRLLIARVRFYELGSDEVRGFIWHQLPSTEAENIFTEEVIAAIANVSGGDPVVVNRFSRRMLDRSVASTGDTIEKADLRSGTVMLPDVTLSKSGVTIGTEELQQNYAPSRPDAQVSTRMWPRRGVGLKLGACIGFCLSCLGVVATIHPLMKGIAPFTAAPASDTPTKVPEHAPLVGSASPELNIASTAEEPMAVPGKAARTAMVGLATTMPEDALAPKTPAPSPSVAALRSPVELAPEGAAETTVDPAILPAAPTTEVGPMSTAVSPAGTRVSNPTTSASDQAPKLRLPPEEVTALLARGDKLLALRDISSARLFYERAADAGEGRAALKLGRTFDPAFLYLAHLTVSGDRAIAEFWYSRARELGEPEAEILLKGMGAASQD